MKGKLPSVEELAKAINVHGIVQGVGFRPFVYRLAREFGLTGTIANTGNGVMIELQGKESAIEGFCDTLRTKPPSMSRITGMTIAGTATDVRRTEFVILPSRRGDPLNTLVSPDLALCEECRREIFTPGNRRYHYPFTNCSHCGPRFSIVESIPYDRANTSMHAFSLCGECSREYHDPSNRRFHAQPNCCPDCGPSLQWCDAQGSPLSIDNCITACTKALSRGAVVAIKGLGGFHLAVDATDFSAVEKLRCRKHRKEKPLAVMVRDLTQANIFCRVSEAEGKLLNSPARPIVLLQRQEGSILAENLAPEIGLLGLILPYTALHHLLLADEHCPPALVMTSGNLSAEPMCIANDEALQHLGPIADFFLLHDREIITRIDDSVLRVMAGKARMLRRGRGYAPQPLTLGRPTANALGCGAEMKSSFCIIRDNEAFISQHIGELVDPKTLDFYTQNLDHLLKILPTDVQVTACDLHPDYLSTRFCKQQSIPCRSVQHHHAHAAAVMAEHGLDEPALAVLLDGSGYGDRNFVYGGEWYRADRYGYTRLAHLAPLPLPGGDRAIREPWRMAMALLYQTWGRNGLATHMLPPSLHAVDEDKRLTITQMMDKGVNCPLTSSCGRLFDGIAALLGLCLTADYEGQAAMQLEYQAGLAKGVDPSGKISYTPNLTREDGGTVLDTRPLTARILEDLDRGVSIAEIGLAFHYWLADGCVEVLCGLRRGTGLSTVILGGGSLQNKILLEEITARCTALDFTVFCGEQVPSNDGSIALGQAYIAGAPVFSALTPTRESIANHQETTPVASPDAHR